MSLLTKKRITFMNFIYQYTLMYENTDCINLHFLESSYKNHSNLFKITKEYTKDILLIELFNIFSKYIEEAIYNIRIASKSKKKEI